MQIILIRHGEAEPLKRTDAERNLTLNGLHQAQQAAAWLLNHQYVIDGLFASPYFRARQTAGELANVLEIPVTLTDRITPDRDPREVMAWLESQDLPDEAVIALVCHMPVIGRLASWLVRGRGWRREDVAGGSPGDRDAGAGGGAGPACCRIPAPLSVSGSDDASQADAGDAAKIGADSPAFKFVAQFLDHNLFDLAFHVRHDLAQQRGQGPRCSLTSSSRLVISMVIMARTPVGKEGRAS
jgi:phosphohistidine phosphatase